jgi:hypothetical protein
MLLAAAGTLALAGISYGIYTVIGSGEGGIFVVQNIRGILSKLSEEELDELTILAEERTRKIRLARRPKRIYLVRHGESLGQVDGSTYKHIADTRVPVRDSLFAKF